MRQSGGMLDGTARGSAAMCERCTVRRATLRIIIQNSTHVVRTHARARTIVLRTNEMLCVRLRAFDARLK
jgi:hypothetical protein